LLLDVAWAACVDSDAGVAACAAVSVCVRVVVRVWIAIWLSVWVSVLVSVCVCGGRRLVTLGDLVGLTPPDPHDVRTVTVAARATSAGLHPRQRLKKCRQVVTSGFLSSCVLGCEGWAPGARLRSCSCSRDDLHFLAGAVQASAAVAGHRDNVFDAHTETSLEIDAGVRWISTCPARAVGFRPSTMYGGSLV
jgi:hypothetical protein